MDDSPVRQTACIIEDSARLIAYLRSDAPNTRHRIDAARALIKSTRELIQRLEGESLHDLPAPVPNQVVTCPEPPV
jgi:hypothetical protein